MSPVFCREPGSGAHLVVPTTSPHTAGGKQVVGRQLWPQLSCGSVHKDLFLVGSSQNHASAESGK